MNGRLQNNNSVMVKVDHSLNPLCQHFLAVWSQVICKPESKRLQLKNGDNNSAYLIRLFLKIKWDYDVNLLCTMPGMQ